MMASAQVVETSVNTNNSPSQDYTTNPDDHSNHNKMQYPLLIDKYKTKHSMLVQIHLDIDYFRTLKETFQNALETASQASMLKQIYSVSVTATQ